MAADDLRRMMAEHDLERVLEPSEVALLKEAASGSRQAIANREGISTAQVEARLNRIREKVHAAFPGNISAPAPRQPPHVPAPATVTSSKGRSRPSLQDRVQALLRDRASASTRELADELGAREESIREATSRLRTAGLVEQVSPGRRGTPAVWRGLHPDNDLQLPPPPGPPELRPRAAGAHLDGPVAEVELIPAANGYQAMLEHVREELETCTRLANRLEPLQRLETALEDVLRA